MRSIFAYEECLDCRWKSSHKGTLSQPFSFGCLAFIALLFLAPFLTPLLSIPYMIYGGIGLLVIIALLFLRHGIYAHKLSKPSIKCPACGSTRIKHHCGLWE